MAISTTLVLNPALDTEFNDGAKTYKIKLLYDGVPSESSPETVTFTGASGGSVGLSSSVFFAVPSGTSVIGVQVLDNLDNVLVEEGINPAEVFSSNGTYTVNNVLVTISEV